MGGSQTLLHIPFISYERALFCLNMYMYSRNAKSKNRYYFFVSLFTVLGTAFGGLEMLIKGDKERA